MKVRIKISLSLANFLTHSRSYFHSILECPQDIYEQTLVHSAQSSLVVTHPSTNTGRRRNRSYKYTYTLIITHRTSFHILHFTTTL